jgi:iron complex outermembrane receptor protein
LSSAAGQLAADFIESAGNGRPTLGPEDATNFSFGASFSLGDTDWTVDYYNIELTDRVALGANVSFVDALNYAGGSGANYATVSEGLTDLDARGIINRQDFIGLDDLSQFRFFSNSFDTTTTGIDIVGNYDFALGEGESQLVLALNYNKTEVDNVGTLNPISAGRVQAIEDLLPNTKGNLSWYHTQGDFRTMVRANYYGGWDDTGNGVNGISAEVLVDVEVNYQLNDNTVIALGVENLFDTYPDKNPSAGSLGQLYSEASPFGFNGGAYYLQARFTY